MLSQPGPQVYLILDTTVKWYCIFHFNPKRFDVPGFLGSAKKIDGSTGNFKRRPAMQISSVTVTGLQGGRVRPSDGMLPIIIPFPAEFEMSTNQWNMFSAEI